MTGIWLEVERRSLLLPLSFMKMCLEYSISVHVVNMFWPVVMTFSV